MGWCAKDSLPHKYFCLNTWAVSPVSYSFLPESKAMSALLWCHVKRLTLPAPTSSRSFHDPSSSPLLLPVSLLPGRRWAAWRGRRDSPSAPNRHLFWERSQLPLLSTSTAHRRLWSEQDRGAGPPHLSAASLMDTLSSFCLRPTRYFAFALVFLLLFSLPYLKRRRFLNQRG